MKKPRARCLVVGGVGLAALAVLLVVGGASSPASATARARRTAPPPGVAPAIWELLGQIDERWPNRSRASDGTLGDSAHQARVSDHNTGLALDVTFDPSHGPDLERLAAALLRDPRVTYVIWRRRIANRLISGGAWRRYSGPNPHDHHLHVSIHEAARADVSPWNLRDVPA